MDILNWLYLAKNKLVKTTVQDPEKDLVILGGNASFAKRGDKYQSYGMTVEDFAAAVGGLRGESYILVKGDNPDPAVNGAELKAAYDIALASTPYGNFRGVGNEFSVIIGPGTYDMRAYNATYGWELTGDYINMISLTGEPDVVISTFCVIGGSGTYKGLNTEDAPLMGLGATGQILMGNLAINSINANFENCLAGSYSFGAGIGITGSFKNCKAGSYSFGTTLPVVPGGYIAPPQSPGILNGGFPLGLAATFENCTAGSNSFGSSNALSAFLQISNSTFKNCTSGSNSFGYSLNSIYIYNSTFTDCVALNGGSSFGSSLNANSSSNVYISDSNVFTNCKTLGFGTTPGQSFGYTVGNPGTGYINIYATYTNCSAGDQSFGYTLGSAYLGGKFINCEAGDQSFGFNPFSLANTSTGGTFTNCIAGSQCFGAMASGIFTNCRSGNPDVASTGGAAFGYGIDAASVDAAGTFISCISEGRSAFGSAAFGILNITGSFYSCVSGSDSFGNMDAPGTSGLSGKALYCHKTAGSFYTSPGGAKAILCINSALTVQTI